MTFQPRMTNRIDGFSVVECHHRRYWQGMVADVWSVDCAPRAGGHYVGRHPRLFIPLDVQADSDGDFRMWEIGHRPLNNCQRRSVSFIPAEMEMQTDVRGIRHLRHLDIHFDSDMLVRRLGGDLDVTTLDEPRMMLLEPRLIALAELIAAECTSNMPLHDLYGDGLTLALMIDVLKVQATERRRRSPLAGWQLKRAIEFIEDNCLRPIRLDELAQLTGLSESHFSHAFKATTGIPPYQWQMNARIAQVKDRLKNSAVALTELASETGFADAAHFSRTFRRHVGLSPSEWRRLHRD